MNVFDLYAKLSLDDDGYTTGLANAQTSGESFLGKIGSAVAGAGKAIAVGIGAGATAVAALTKSAVQSYADYEQLVGGVETLFGAQGMSISEYAKSVGKTVPEVQAQYIALQAAQTSVLDAAANAYKTAGMSANEYMETVTSFSASLIAGLGGDTVKAAQYADMAITDMSDNANKFGTDIESISNAYMGFAKGNFQMLDNLKLSYGGTASEMVRLINDSGILKDKIDNLDNISFDQMVQAIHVVQENMGIAGTTAKEAGSTIAGSLSSAKSAWANLVTGIADDSQDFGTLVDNFVSSVDTAAGNILPRIETALGGIGKLIDTMLPEIVDRVPQMFMQVAPGIIQAGADMIVSLVSGLKNSLPQIISSGKEIIGTLVDTIVAILPDVLTIGAELIGSIIDGIAKEAPGLLQAGVDTAVGLINSLASGIAQNVPQVLSQALPMLMQFTGQLRENAGQLVDAGMNLLMQLAQGIADSIPTLVETVPTIVSNIANIINDNMPKILETGVNMIVTLGQGLLDAIPTIVENIPQIITAVVDVFTAFNWLDLGKNIIGGISNGIKAMVGTVKSAGKNIFQTIINTLKALPQNLLNLAKNGVSGIANAFRGGLSGIKSAAGNILSNVVSALQQMPGKLLELAKSAVTNLKDAFTNGNWKDIGKNIINGIANGLNTYAKNLLDAAMKAVDNAIDWIKNKLGIHSPSKVMREEVGKQIAAGMALGILDGQDEIAEAMGELTANVEPGAALGGVKRGGGVTVVQNIYSKKQTAASLMREARYEQQRAVLLGRA